MRRRRDSEAFKGSIPALALNNAPVHMFATCLIAIYCCTYIVETINHSTMNIFSLFLQLATLLHLTSTQQTCTSCGANTIAATYPSSTTGVINATLSAIIVPLSYARSLIPPQFPILNNAYTRFGIPPDQYPILIDAQIDHDIEQYGLNLVPDFSSFHVSFPFVDLLGDGYSNFKYDSYIYLSLLSPIAIAGTAAYNITVLPATFAPGNAAYTEESWGELSFEVFAGLAQVLGDPPAASVLFHETNSISPLPLSFFKNTTNQPQFGGNGLLCDNMIRFWNTTLSKGENVPIGLLGTVNLSPPVVPSQVVYSGVHGVAATTAFIENNYMNCSTLKGYGGTGSGDSG